MNKIIEFLNQVKQLLGKVTWPDKKTLVRLTTVVILLSVSLGLLLGVFDVFFTRLIGILVK